jgi:outer membrane lipoprotein-sorting protein
MSAMTAWDRASSLPVPVDGRARPEIVALRTGLPTVDELFTFMRDAELRFENLRMRIEEHAWNTQGDELSIIEVTVRHPGEARIQTSIPARGITANYELWLSDGRTVQTYVAERKLGTKRPVRRTVRGVADAEDLPGRSRVYLPVTPLQAESLPELFIHPAGYCQNVLGTGTCTITGETEVAGREAIVLECDHPRTIEVTADRPDFRVRIAVDRADGVILRLEETIAGSVTRDAIVTSYTPNATLPATAFSFTFPSDTTFLY